MPPAAYGSPLHKRNHPALNGNTEPQRYRCTSDTDTPAVTRPLQPNPVAAVRQQGHSNRTGDQSQLDPKRIERSVFGGTADKKKPTADDRVAQRRPRHGHDKPGEVLGVEPSGETYQPEMEHQDLTDQGGNGQHMRGRNSSVSPA